MMRPSGLEDDLASEVQDETIRTLGVTERQAAAAAIVFELLLVVAFALGMLK